MTETVLGKITSAEFGRVKDYPFLVGIQFEFKLSNCGFIGDGGKYTVNLSDQCHWDASVRESAIVCSIERVYALLKEARVNYVSELLGKPVEVTVENSCFKDFRILTEVL